jgi:sulfur relay (sulfurtransferase) complex TusBCD TusD component (DsrE family)
MAKVKQDIIKLDSASIDQYKPQVQALGKWFKVLAIAERSEYDDAGKTLALVREIFDAAEAQRKLVTAPLDQGIKAFRAIAKKVTEPLKQLDEHLTGLMAKYTRQEQEIAMREANKLAKKEEKKGNTEYAQDIILAAKHEAKPENPDAMKSVSQWIATVVDIKALCAGVAYGSIPEAFVQASMKELISYAKSTKGTGKIPGVTFKEDFYFIRAPKGALGHSDMFGGEE